MLLLDDQYFIVFECFVAAGDDALTRLQTFEHFIVLRILTANTDISAIGLRATFVEHENPLPASCLEESAARDEHGLLGLAQLQVDVVGLACADVQ